jgi:hypothetical protein
MVGSMGPPKALCKNASGINMRLNYWSFGKFGAIIRGVLTRAGGPLVALKNAIDPSAAINSFDKRAK